MTIYKIQLLKNFHILRHNFLQLELFGFIDISMIFLITSIVVYLINKNEIRKNGGFYKLFFEGAADLLSVAGIIVVAAAVQFILRESLMQNLIVSGLNFALGGLHKTLFIFLTFILFLLISIFIPSSSGFATAIFSIFGTNANLAGLASGSVTAFTYASGIINLASPTSGIFVAACSISKMPLNAYYKTAWPLLLAITGTSLIIILIGSIIPSSSMLF